MLEYLRNLKLLRERRPLWNEATLTLIGVDLDEGRGGDEKDNADEKRVANPYRTAHLLCYNGVDHKEQDVGNLGGHGKVGVE